MWNESVRTNYLDTGDKRIIVVSDIHANLPYLKGLLQRVGFSDGDILIVDGDFLEKRDGSLETLRYLADLSARGLCRVVCGNCDGWSDAVDAMSEFWAERIVDYMLIKRSGVIYEMLGELGVTVVPGLDFRALLPALRERFRAEFDFIRSLPHVIETEHMIFVHGGLRTDLPREAQHGGSVMKFDNFLGTDYAFGKWLVVGHWPVVLYHNDVVCATPIIDRRRHIISIDGGCTLKDDGQLNALIIPHDGSEDFSFASYDPFPVYRVKTPQSRSERSYYIRWGDNKVEILRRGEEFSLCRHIRTGYEMEILNRYLRPDGDIYRTNDCTDLVLELSPGDEVSVVERTGRGVFCKHRGTSGWYFGELEPVGEPREPWERKDFCELP